MDQILKDIGNQFAELVSSPFVQLIFQAFGIYIVILWLATAYWAFRDMQRRTENPILPYLAATFIIISTPVLFLFAWWVYKIVRPKETSGEVYERNLAEEALLSELEAIRHCPTCNRRTHDDWIVCPSCRTRLNRVCPNCSRLVGLDWSLCAWCGKDFERREALAPVAFAPLVTPSAADAPGDYTQPDVAAASAGRSGTRGRTSVRGVRPAGGAAPGTTAPGT